MKSSPNVKDILVLNRSFWPDIEATGQFLTALCERLSEKYKVAVITGRSYYANINSPFPPASLYQRENFKGIEILRVRHTTFWKKSLAKRFLNWVTYLALAFAGALGTRTKMMIACTDPPLLGIIAMAISRIRGIPFIYNCRDLYPEVAYGLRMLKEKDLPSVIYDRLNKKALNASSLVVCLGESMRARIISKGIPAEKVMVITDWADTSEIKPVLRNENPLASRLGFKDHFIIMHSGNIGFSQDFSSLMRSVPMVKNASRLKLVFIGAGAARETLDREIEALGFENVVFLPFQPSEMLSYSLGMADLHIIALKAGMAGAIVPSKVYGIMAAGRPYLAITDKESEPARLIEECGCGLWAPPGDTKAIAGAIEWAMANKDKLEEMGRRGRRAAEERFDKEVVIRKWLELLAGFDYFCV